VTVREISGRDASEIRNLFVRSIRCQLDERNATTLKWLSQIREMYGIASGADIADVCRFFPVCRMAKSLYQLTTNIRFEDYSKNSFAGIGSLEELSLALTVRGY